MDRIPDLTPQTLSNLVKRDSHRSDWERAIAEALGVSVAWLVYGQEDAGADPQPVSGAALSLPEPQEIAQVVALMRRMTPVGREMVLDHARVVAARHSAVVKANGAR